MAIYIGEGKPQFRIYQTVADAYTNWTATTGYTKIDLPYCEKIVETFTPNQIVHELQHGKDALPMGYDYSALLDYSGFISGDTLMSLAPLFQNRGEIVYPNPSGGFSILPGNTFQIYFIPRVDILSTTPENSRAFRVYIREAFDLSMIKGQGHSGFKLTVDGMDLVRSIPLG